MQTVKTENPKLYTSNPIPRPPSHPSEDQPSKPPSTPRASNSLSSAGHHRQTCVHHITTSPYPSSSPSASAGQKNNPNTILHRQQNRSKDATGKECCSRNREHQVPTSGIAACSSQSVSIMSERSSSVGQMLSCLGLNVRRTCTLVVRGRPLLTCTFVLHTSFSKSFLAPGA